MKLLIIIPKLRNKNSHTTDYPVSPLRHVSRLGSFISTFISAPSLSETPRSDALHPAQPVYACVSSVRHFVFLRLSIKEIIQYHPFGMSQGWGLLSQLLSLPLSSVSDALPLPNLCVREYHG